MLQKLRLRISFRSHGAAFASLTSRPAPTMLVPHAPSTRMAWTAPERITGSVRTRHLHVAQQPLRQAITVHTHAAAQLQVRLSHAQREDDTVRNK